MKVVPYAENDDLKREKKVGEGKIKPVVVNFRVTYNQYQDLKAKADRKGANISEIVREALGY